MSTHTPSETKTYDKELLLKWYEQMLLIRKFEERSSQLYMQQKFTGFLHLYIGQEAVAVGLESAIRPDDYVITAYRDHGGALARGVDPKACMAELYGKVTGCSKGNGGSMHFFSKEKNFLGGHGIVGGQIPLAAGLGYASKYQGTDKLSVGMMGDGAVRQGAFHETMNLAMLWNIPTIFIIENNNYAMGTSVERTSNVTDLYKLGLSYDMPSRAVDAMDVMTVYENMKEVVEHVRSGKGPYLVEMKTYRYKGHSMSDPMKYRTREELNKYRGMDPIANLKIAIMENNEITDEEIKNLDNKIKNIIDECVKFAEESPYPDTSALYEYNYVGEYPYIMD